jgi:type II secretory ATPase GspE/PulE/Tfp pilus assembly ATPase PilB-like protein
LHTGYCGRVPLIEWLRVDEAVREFIRRRELSGIVPRQSLEAMAHSLVQQGVTNNTEYKRIFGL